MSRVIAIVNQKGGVGKTTTTINLGAALAACGRTVLLVDIDPQGNLTSGVGQKDQRGPRGTIYEALTTDEPSTATDDYTRATAMDRLWILPADRQLTGAEIEMVPLTRREERLRLLLSNARDRYDFILIDCPPSLGLLTLNGLVAADSVLIPLHCEFFAIEGLAELVSGTIRRVRAAMNPTLDIEGVLLTMYEERTNLGQQVANEVRQFFKEKVFTTVIPRNVRLAEAPSHGMPVLAYDPKSRGAEAYLALGREVIERHDARELAASAR